MFVNGRPHQVTIMWSSKQEGWTSRKYMKTSFHGNKERFSHTSSSGSSRFFTTSTSYGRYIFGGGFCAGVCFLWYRNHSRMLLAKSSSSELSNGSKVILKDTLRNAESAISESRTLLQRVKDEHGCPGIVAAVSINGHHIWSDAIGLSDVENRFPMTTDHVIRIASISKVLTVTALAKLWERKKLDIDKPVQEFVPSFPEKTWENKKVTITTRQLLSHLSGIRHYEKVVSKEDTLMVTSDSTKESLARKNYGSISQDSLSDTTASSTHLKKRNKESEINSGIKENEDIGDGKYVEFFSRKKYEKVSEALDQFKDDPLVNKPGTKFLYSTHAWTLVSAVVESAAKKPYLEVMKEMFDDLGLHHTLPDQHALLIPNRSRFYQRSKKTKTLENAPYVDVSNKWAGGGFMSTVDDLITFADAMLYSYQFSASSTEGLPGYLNTKTICQLWKPVDIARPKEEEGAYGMGWKIVQKPQKYGKCQQSKFFVSHSGGAVGASSILLIAADNNNKSSPFGENSLPPRGVSVAIMVNIDGVSLHKTAEKIAVLFKDTVQQS